MYARGCAEYYRRDNSIEISLPFFYLFFCPLCSLLNFSADHFIRSAWEPIKRLIRLHRSKLRWWKRWFYWLCTEDVWCTCFLFLGSLARRGSRRPNKQPGSQLIYKIFANNFRSEWVEAEERRERACKCGKLFIESTQLPLKRMREESLCSRLHNRAEKSRGCRNKHKHFPFTFKCADVTAPKLFRRLPHSKHTLFSFIFVPFILRPRISPVSESSALLACHHQSIVFQLQCNYSCTSKTFRMLSE